MGENSEYAPNVNASEGNNYQDDVTKGSYRDIDHIMRNWSTLSRNQDSVPLRTTTVATSVRPPARRRKRMGSGTACRVRILK